MIVQNMFHAVNTVAATPNWARSRPTTLRGWGCERENTISAAPMTPTM